MCGGRIPASTWNDGSGLAFAAIARVPPVVIMLVGISGSGKTTLVTKLTHGRPDLTVVSYDACQHLLDGTDPARAGRAPDITDRAVALAHARLRERCAAGLSTVVDGTHRQERRRRSLVAAALGVPVLALVLRVSPAVAIARQRSRARWIPDDHVLIHHAQISAALPRLHTEGYAAVLVTEETGRP